MQVPENEDVNSLLQGHSPEILSHLIKTRKEYDFLFSVEKSIEKEKDERVNSAGAKVWETFDGVNHEVGGQANPIMEEVKEDAPKPQTTGLDASNPYNLKYAGTEARYQVKGFKLNQLDSLKITLQIQKA